MPEGLVFVRLPAEEVDTYKESPVENPVVFTAETVPI